MKAAFALLADYETHNVIQKLTWQMFQRHGISLQASRLPPHVSLKQPFHISNISALDDYMVDFAASLTPIDITLTEMQLLETPGAERPSSILWLKAEPSPSLRHLHSRLNEELAMRFGDTQADFDGPDYDFHLTLSIGELSSRYHEAYQEFAGSFTPLRFQAQSLAVFAYDNSITMDEGWEYISYKILPLGRWQ